MQDGDDSKPAGQNDAMSSIERRASISLATIMATRMLGLFMILPIFALHAESLPDASPFLIGMAIGVYGLTQAIFQIPFGMASDRFGRRRMITLGLLLFALGSVVAALSESLTGIIIGRAIQGSGAVAAVIMAFTADLTRESQRTKAMAMIGMSIGGAFTLALIAGPLLNAVVGVSGIFWLTALLAFAGILILWTQVPHAAHAHTHRDAQLVPELTGSVLKNTQLLRLDVGILILHMVLTAMFIAVPFVLRDHLAIDADLHSWVYLPVLLLSAVAMVPFIILAERKRRMKMIFVSSIAVLGLSMVAMGQWFTQSWLFFFFLWLFFTAFNFLEASLPSLVTKTAPADRKGTAMGVYSSSQFLGAFIGGSAGGWVYGVAGISGVFMLSAALVGVWWILALTMRSPSYLSSMVVAVRELTQTEADELAKKLAQIPGVAEAVVIADEAEAYLKVDNRTLDREAVSQAIEL